INAGAGDVLRRANSVIVCHNICRSCGLAFSTATNAMTFHSVNLGANLSLVNSSTQLSLATAFELDRLLPFVTHNPLGYWRPLTRMVFLAFVEHRRRRYVGRGPAPHRSSLRTSCGDFGGARRVPLEPRPPQRRNNSTGLVAPLDVMCIQ